MRDVYRIKYPGVIDADGHILEPPDLWERYLEPRYRDRALRIRTDDEGLEYLEIGGKAVADVAQGISRARSARWARCTSRTCGRTPSARTSRARRTARWT